MKKFYSFLASLFFISFIQAQTIRPEFPFTNGSVSSIGKWGNNIYIGGNFTTVGFLPTPPPPDSAKYFAVIDPVTGVPQLPMVKPNGEVMTTVSDGAGGWYIGGNFSTVGGQPRKGIARINPDGTLHPWNPGVDGYVQAIAVNGNTVYAGGLFFNANGQPRRNIAAFDAVTGIPTSWHPDPNSGVEDILIDGNTIYICGYFVAVNGVNPDGLDGPHRPFLASFDLNTGLLTPFSQQIGGYGVESMLINNNILYITGSFTTVNGLPRPGLAAFDVTMNTLTDWNPSPSGGGAGSVVVDGNTVYVGGSFSSIGGQPRSGLAAVDATTGLATPWISNTDLGVRDILIQNNILYAGGYFNSVNGQTRHRLAAIDLLTGNPLPWNPDANNRVWALKTDGNKILASGDFTNLGTAPPVPVNPNTVRNHLAAFDANTGAILPWDPNANGIVNDFKIVGNTMYIGGDFTTIGGVTRNRLAAIDLTTGLLTPWNPVAYSAITSLAVSGDNVYVSGFFDGCPVCVGGDFAHNMAGLSATTGLRTPSPDSDGPVFQVAANGNMLYIGGGFTSLGSTRYNIGAANGLTGGLSGWYPPSGTNNSVNSFGFGPNTIYVGGGLTQIGGQSRNYLAAVDSTTGIVTAWNPNPNGSVAVSKTDGNIVYVGGLFTTIGGQTRNRIAAIDATTGLATPWDANASGAVLSILADGNTVFAGGNFTSITGQPRPYFAALANAEESPLPVHLLTFNAKAEYASSWKVNVQWSTASETNSDFYDVERSADGRKWNSIGKVDAAGNSASARNYHFGDDSPLQGISYYRLKQVDADGKFIYSSVSVISISGKGISVLVYPNPVKDISRLMITSQKRKHVSYELIDARGAIMQKGNYSLQSGTNLFEMQVSQLSKGVYYLVITDDGGPVRMKVVKE